MDPVTTAVVAALTRLAEPAVKDAYEALKALLVRKFGKQAEVVKSVTTLESNPESPARQAVLAEEVTSSGAGRDAEVLRAAQALLESAGAGSMTTVQQTVQGDHNIVAGTGDITVHGVR